MFWIKWATRITSEIHFDSLIIVLNKIFSSFGIRYTNKDNFSAIVKNNCITVYHSGNFIIPSRPNNNSQKNNSYNNKNNFS